MVGAYKLEEYQPDAYVMYSFSAVSRLYAYVMLSTSVGVFVCLAPHQSVTVRV